MGYQVAKENKKKLRRKLQPYLLLLPASILVATMMLYPLGKVFYLSLQKYNPTRPFLNGFVGLQNFKDILTSPEFYEALGVSGKWVFSEVILQLVFGMAVALVLNQKFKGRGIARTITFIPWAMSGVLTSVLWGLIFNEHIGLLNDILRKVGLIETNKAWLANSSLVFGSVVVAELWRGIPFFAISLLASLQGIPLELYEAARVDGSGKVKTFWYITLPMLRETIILTTLLRSVWEFNSVDLIYSLTGGGPIGKTTTLSILITKQAMGTNNYGYGSALSVVSFIMLALLAGIYLKVSRFGKEE